MNPNDPAFPAASGQPGLTKREYLVAQLVLKMPLVDGVGGPHAESIKNLVAVADALIAELGGVP